MKNSYRLPCTHSRRHVLAHRCSLSRFERIFRNWILMGEQGREERIYMHTCRKYVPVRVCICIYKWDKMCYVAHTTDPNVERILCFRRNGRRRLKRRDVFISTYSSSAHLNRRPPVGNVDFSETLGERRRGPGCSGQAAAVCRDFPRVPPQKDLSSSPTGFTCKSDFSLGACFPLLSFRF